MVFTTQNKAKKYYKGYQDMTESQTDDPLAAIRRYQQPGMPMPSAEDNHYRQLLDEDFSSPLQAPRDSYNPATNQLLAGLAESANKLGTLGGKHADSGEVGRFADVLAKSHAAREQQQQQAMQRRQNILTKLAELRDKQNEAGTKSQLQRDLSGEKIASQEKLAREKMAHDTKIHGMKETARESSKSAEQKLNLTPAEKAIDLEFGKTKSKFEGAGLPQIKEAIKNLEHVSEELGKNPNASGPIVGLFPDLSRNITNPDAMRLKRLVKNEVLKSARELLGGGVLSDTDIKLALESGWVDQASPKENQAVVNALIRKAKGALAQRQAEIEWFNANKGTLRGFKAPEYKVPGGYENSPKSIDDASDEELDHMLEQLRRK